MNADEIVMTDFDFGLDCSPRRRKKKQSLTVSLPARRERIPIDAIFSIGRAQDDFKSDKSIDFNRSLRIKKKVKKLSSSFTVDSRKRSGSTSLYGSIRAGRSRKAAKKWSLQLSDIDLLIRILENESTYEAFLEFAKQEYAGESVLFWKAVTEYKEKAEEVNFDDVVDDEEIFESRDSLMQGIAQLKIQELCHSIYDTYIANDSPHTVNIGHRAKKDIEKRLDSGSDPYATYDKAVNDILILMAGDTLTRFRFTPAFDHILVVLYRAQSA